MGKLSKFIGGLIVAFWVALGSWLGGTALADLSNDNIYLLNKKFSPSVAAKVELGTVLAGAENSVGKFDEDVLQEVSGTLTQAQIVSMFTTPVTLVAAPGAGKLTVVDEVELFHDYSTAAYTGGGDVTIEYATSGVDLFVVDVAEVTGATDVNYLFKTGNAAPFATSATASSAQSWAASVNKAVTITNASAVFAAGNVANIFKYRIRYRVITLQT